MTISPEAKEAARIIHSACPWPSSEGFIEHYIQQAINSATDSANKSCERLAKGYNEIERERDRLQKEIARLRGEVEKAYREGFSAGAYASRISHITNARAFAESRARRVAEGKE